MTVHPRAVTRAAALVGLVAAVVAGAGSWIPSLWGDEAASVLSALRPLSTLGPMLLHVDAVHGLYYAGLHGWVGLFGASPFAVRLPSALAAGATAAAVVWIGARGVSLRLGIGAGLVCAVLPRLTYAGAEARSSAIAAALAAVLCAIVVEILLRERPRRRWWVAYAGVLALGTWVFLYFALMALAVGAALAITPSWRRTLRPWLIASAAAALAAAPLVAVAATEAGQIGFLAGQDVVTWPNVVVHMWFGSAWFALAAWTLIGVAAAGWLLRVRRGGQAGVPLEPLALCWLVLPMGALIAASPLVAGYTTRYGTFSAPAAALLIALGIRRLAARRLLAALAALVLVAAAGPVWAAQRTPYAKNGSDWNDIAAVVRSQARPGDAIVFGETRRYALRPRLAMDTDPESFADLRDVTLAVPYPQATTWHDTVRTVAEAARLHRFDGVQRVWLVEYRSGGTADDWGVADLVALGFRSERRIEGRASVIDLYVRAVR